MDPVSFTCKGELVSGSMSSNRLQPDTGLHSGGSHIVSGWESKGLHGPHGKSRLDSGVEACSVTTKGSSKPRGF